MASLESIAIMTPLPVKFDNFSKYILEQSWSSLYSQFSHVDILPHVYFSSIPKLFESYTEYLAQGFKLPYSLVKVEETGNQGVQNESGRLLELAFHRNALLDEAKKHRWGLFLDSDVILPSNAILNLILDEEDIAAGIIPQIRGSTPVKIQNGKIANFEDFMVFLAIGFFDETFKYVAWGDLQKVEAADVVATACMLLSHKIMNDARVKFCLFPSGNGGFLGEDVGYCFSAHRNRYKVSVDPAVLCRHMRRLNDRLAAYLQAPQNLKCAVNFLFWDQEL